MSSSSSPRRAAAGLAALVLTTLALSACSGEVEGGGDTGRTDVAASSPAPAPTSAPASPSAPPSPKRSDVPSPSHSAQVPARWAGSKQFVQVDNAWIKDGRTYLSVRPARKVPVTGRIEAWNILPGKGPYTTVRMAPGGRVLLSVPLGDDSAPHAYSQAQFISRYWAQPASYRGSLGYDVSFDLNGEVVRLQSLYTP
ncbi:hypothetical protein [Actinacidiphila sp. bgisy160]|uniref:hypothetical protein n=1 Tax=Actinacidiphila sp. bgisy160 TaxID=3413796 RepID=UPI003D7459A3